MDDGIAIMVKKKSSLIALGDIYSTSIASC